MKCGLPVSNEDGISDETDRPRVERVGAATISLSRLTDFARDAGQTFCRSMSYFER